MNSIYQSVVNATEIAKEAVVNVVGSLTEYVNRPEFGTMQDSWTRWFVNFGYFMVQALFFTFLFNRVLWCCWKLSIIGGKKQLQPKGETAIEKGDPVGFPNMTVNIKQLILHTSGSKGVEALELYDDAVEPETDGVSLRSRDSDDNVSTD